MNKIIVLSVFVVASVLFLFQNNPVSAAQRVRGYFRKSGTYVMPYYRSNYNRTKLDNWSTKGNYNLYTGKKGYKSWY